MGYQNGKRIGVGELDKLQVYSQEAVTKLVKEGSAYA